MSAAFDIVDHPILLKKLQLYGFDSGFLEWIASYLDNRSQCVSIDGCLSKLRLVQQGVPQGSVLGPLLYIIFTNELPEVVHSHCSTEDRGEEVWPNFTMVCSTCGCIGCYADDTTYTCSGSDTNSITENITDKYQLMSEFLASNKLKLNDDKTHLMVMSTSQARLSRLRKGDSSMVRIRTSIKDIEPSQSEKLLGCWLHEDMKWGEHIQDNRESLLRSLNSRVGALKMVCKVAGFKTRKMIANGIFMSKIMYCIALWGGCANQLLNSLQKVQNKAARAVTKVDWNTPTKLVLRQCGWLSVKQLVVYQSSILVYKVMRTASPRYLYSMFSTEYTCNTRQASSGQVKLTRRSNLDISEESFRCRGAKYYNNLPIDLREAVSVSSFKTGLRRWILDNVPAE